jgi:hypothetical protein
VGAKAAALGAGEAGNASPWMVVKGIDASSSATFALQLDSRAESPQLAPGYRGLVYRSS